MEPVKSTLQLNLIAAVRSPWNHSYRTTQGQWGSQSRCHPKLSQQPPHKQGPVGPAPHSRTTSPSLLTSNGATRPSTSTHCKSKQQPTPVEPSHRWSPARKYQLPHNQWSNCAPRIMPVEKPALALQMDSATPKISGEP